MFLQKQNSVEVIITGNTRLAFERYSRDLRTLIRFCSQIVLRMGPDARRKKLQFNSGHMKVEKVVGKLTTAGRLFPGNDRTHLLGNLTGWCQPDCLNFRN